MLALNPPHSAFLFQQFLECYIHPSLFLYLCIGCMLLTSFKANGISRLSSPPDLELTGEAVICFVEVTTTGYEEAGLQQCFNTLEGGIEMRRKTRREKGKREVTKDQRRME